jgi:hypothetical protein
MRNEPNSKSHDYIKLPALALSLLLLLVGCEQKHHFTPPGAGAFTDIREKDIVGSYKWFQNGIEMGVTKLEPDHSLTSFRGEKKGGYKWELQKEGLLLIWDKGFNFFPRVISDGVYEGQKDSWMVRIEKK